MIQQRMTDISEELKANRVCAFMYIQSTSKRDMIEFEDEVGAVDDMIDIALAYKQKTPTELREFGCWAYYWGGKICQDPSDFVLPKSKPLLSLWLS